MDLGLKGLRAVVTGGSKGIGRAAADIFAQEGASVAICARNADEVKAAVKDLTAKGVQRLRGRRRRGRQGRASRNSSPRARRRLAASTFWSPMSPRSPPRMSRNPGVKRSTST